MNTGAYALAAESELATAELASTGVSPGDGGVVTRLGRRRIPLTLHHRPWATAYRLPDGRVVWCLKLWEDDRARVRCVRTATLAAYLRESGYGALAAEVEAIGGR